MEFSSFSFSSKTTPVNSLLLSQDSDSGLLGNNNIDNSSSLMSGLNNETGEIFGGNLAFLNDIYSVNAPLNGAPETAGSIAYGGNTETAGSVACAIGADGGVSGAGASSGAGAGSGSCGGGSFSSIC